MHPTYDATDGSDSLGGFQPEGTLVADPMRTELPQLTPEMIKVRFKLLQGQTNNVYQNWQIRVHRSLSWFNRSTQLPADQPETKFLLLWISFNCLRSPQPPVSSDASSESPRRSNARACPSRKLGDPRL